MIRAFTILLAGTLLISSLYGQSKEDLQRQKQRAFDEIKLARELMEQTAEKKSSSVQGIRLLQRGIDSRAQLIGT